MPLKTSKIQQDLNFKQDACRERSQCPVGKPGQIFLLASVTNKGNGFFGFNEMTGACHQCGRVAKALLHQSPGARLTMGWRQPANINSVFLGFREVGGGLGMMPY